MININIETLLARNQKPENVIASLLGFSKRVKNPIRGISPKIKNIPESNQKIPKIMDNSFLDP